jgi:hypothetical protein
VEGRATVERPTHAVPAPGFETKQGVVVIVRLVDDD